MTNEIILQILLIVVYLAIGLISATFPVYALCIPYLRQEKLETEKEIKRHKAQIKERLGKSVEQLDLRHL